MNIFLNDLKKLKLVNKKQSLKIAEYFKNTLNKKYLETSYDHHVEILSRTSNHLLIKVLNYEASKRHGSDKWCISYSEEHWDKYVTKDNSSQYFLWTKRGDNVYTASQLVGFTISRRGYFHCCYDNYNDGVFSDVLLKIFKINKVKFDFKISKAMLAEEAAAKKELEEVEDEEDDDELDGFCPGYFTDYD